MVTAVNNVNNNVNVQSFQFKPERKKTNPLLVLATGAAGCFVGGACGVASVANTPESVGLTKSERDWLFALKNSINKDDPFNYGNVMEGYSEKLSKMYDDIKSTIILDGRVKELSEFGEKSKDYQSALKRFNETKKAVDDAVSKFSMNDLNAMAQDNLLKPDKWAEALLKRQKVALLDFSIPIAKELNFLKKAALGGILGVAAGLVINRYISSKNK